MENEKKPAEPRERPRRYLHVMRPRCPECGAVRLRAYRTCQNGDGSATRYATCLACGVKLLIVVE